MDIRTIKPEIDKYLDRLKKDIGSMRVLLYGSFADGKARKGSDVDIIILSSRFARMEDDERLKLLYRKSVGFPYNLHVYGLTQDEYDKASPLTTLGAIKNKAKILKVVQ